MKHRKIFSILIVATISTVALASGNVDEAFKSPDHLQPTCVATPAELAAHPEAMQAVKTFGGLTQVIGTWKLSGIPFMKQLVSFSYDNDGFYVQTGDDIPAKTSLCAVKNSSRQLLLRISVHKPGCPENKNIYVRATEVGEMSLRAYATRTLGSVTFKKKSPIPLPPGKPKKKPLCAHERQDETQDDESKDD